MRIFGHTLNMVDMNFFTKPTLEIVWDLALGSEPSFKLPFPM